MIDVFKLQTPIATNGPRQVFAYNKDRSAEAFVEMSEEDMELIGLKSFWKCEFNKEKAHIDILEKADWQEW